MPTLTADRCCEQGSRTWTPPLPYSPPNSRFVAVPVAHAWDKAEETCQQHNYCGLASIHNAEEQKQAEQACQMILHASSSNTQVRTATVCPSPSHLGTRGCVHPGRPLAQIA